MLQLPLLARCDNRRLLARTHPTAGDPNQWLSQASLDNCGLHGLSFDFFVNWNARTIGEEVWMKRLVAENHTPWPLLDVSQLLSALAQIDPQISAGDLSAFCTRHALHCHYFLFKDSAPWSRNPAAIVDLSVSSSPPTARLMDVNAISTRIRAQRGAPVPIGPGGLIYGTSSLECHLSRTPDFWPGDADMLLLDSDSKVHSILEFKTLRWTLLSRHERCHV